MGLVHDRNRIALHSESPLLSTDTIALPWWQRYLPGWREALKKRRARYILKNRDAASVKEAWASTPVPFEFTNQVSTIIADSCSWPNGRFLPQDSCFLLFFLDDDLGSVSAMLTLEHELFNGAPFDLASPHIQYFEALTYEVFIAQIYNAHMKHLG